MGTSVNIIQCLGTLGFIHLFMSTAIDIALLMPHNYHTSWTVLSCAVRCVQAYVHCHVPCVVSRRRQVEEAEQARRGAQDVTTGEGRHDGDAAQG